MNTPTYPVPAGYHTVTPSLTIKGAASALEFYKKAFGAVEMYRLAEANGVIMHAEMKIGDSVIMMSDEIPSWGAFGPQGPNGCPALFRLYVGDCDDVFEKAVGAGAE